jgi:hypothetical protein
MSTGRAISLGSIALVAVLSGSLGLWSAFSGPRVADVALHQAAGNLAASSSFVITLHQTESVQGTAEQVQIGEVVHYEAPDSEKSVQTIDSIRSHSVKTITQIGSSCWISSTGPATPFPCMRSEIQHLVGFVKDLETASGVTDDGGTYVLSQKDSASVVAKEASGQLTFGMAKVKVRISGDFISWEELSLDAAVNGASILIDEVVSFSDVGNGPSVLAPPGPPTAIAHS